MFTQPPDSLRGAERKRENLALMTGDLLPFKQEWQQIANGLPDGSVLICLPTTDGPHRTALLTISGLLQAEGHRIRTVPAAWVRFPDTRPERQLPPLLTTLLTRTLSTPLWAPAINPIAALSSAG